MPSVSVLPRLQHFMLEARLVEQRMMLALRQGHLAKWFSGIGQEAVAVGATAALEQDEWVLPLHRNLGVFLVREVPLERLFAQVLGRAGGFTRGRDRTFHFGSPEHHILGMISHLGAQLGVADGVATASKLAGRSKVTLAFIGDGGTSEGDFHEALNLASVWDLPVIFLVENNGYALSTPAPQQYRCQRLSLRAAGYGMEGLTIDGNDVEQVYDTVSRLAAELRQRPRPVLLECLTFRMRGHEEASGTDYVPQDLLERWAARDPVAGLKPPEGMAARIEEAFARALEHPMPEAGEELAAVLDPKLPPSVAAVEEAPVTRFVDALTQALEVAFERDDRVLLMGQDVAGYGGVFKVTRGLAERFGSERVRNTPLCESAVVGASIGLALSGWRPIMEMQFADFASCGFNQIANNLAFLRYRWGGRAPVVIRMPTGGGVGAGPFHSQCLEGLFAGIPGLRILYPAFPEDAKGMLLAAVASSDPVLFFEHKALYRTVRGPVPGGYYRSSLEGARLVRSGDSLAVVTYGMGVHRALEVLESHPELDAALLDLRVLAPLDFEAVAELAGRTGKLLVLQEANQASGVGARLAAYVGEHCFEYLDAPVKVLGSLNTPVPFARTLEAQYLPWGRLEQALLELAAY